MIKLQAIGHLGKDCITNTVNGKNVINFSVAHTEKYKDAQGNLVEKTTWVDCAYWTDRTAISQYLRKGTQVYVEGIPEVRTYPKNDGTTGASLTMKVFNIQLLGGKSENAGSGSPAQQQGNSYSGSREQNVAQEMSEPVDDLPF
ncbi:single-stranded DNA-binding protein [Flavitalea sp.]|nr:single-stranded DNA-binding protein [Flavitalea sp.]